MKKYFWVIASLVATTPLATMVACGSKKPTPVVKSSNLEEMKNKFDNDVTSSKMKSQIRLVDKGAEITDLATIGYSTPEGIPADVIVKYTLKDKSNWEIDEMFEVTVVLTQGTQNVTKDIKITAKAFDWANVKSLIIDVSSTKRKGEIILPNDDAIDKTITPASIGYTSHDVSSIPGVSIEKYELKSKWGIDTDGDTYKFKATVHLKKGAGEAAKKSTKDIFITAKSYDWNNVKALFNNVYSNKKKDKITFPTDKNSGSKIFDDIGYALPDLSSLGVLVDKYTLIKGWETDSDGRHKFQVRFHLKWGNGTTPEITTKDIWITSSLHNINEAIALFKNVVSNKLKSEIKLSTITSIATSLDKIGYDSPLENPRADGFDIQYKLKKDATTDASGWQTADSDKFKLEITLKKNGEERTKVIEITANYDFTTAKQKFQDAESTKSKRDIDSVISGKSVGAPITLSEMGDMGYEAPTDLPNGVIINKYELKTDWQTTDSITNMNKIKVTVTLAKGNSPTAPKVAKDIWIKTYDFTAAKQKFQDAESTKSKRDIDSVISGKSVGAPITLSEMGDMGYEAPTDLPNGVIINKYELKTDWQTTDSITNMNKIKVTVTLAKGNSPTAPKVAKDIWIKTYDFAAAKQKFQDAESTKSKSDIDSVISGKSVGAPITLSEMGDMGYEPPTDLPNGVIINKYELKTDWQNTDPITNMNKIKVTVTLAKGNSPTAPKVAKDIWIKTYDFSAVKQKIKNAKSTLTKEAIDADFNEEPFLNWLGYQKPELVNGVKIKEKSKYVKKEWCNSDGNEDATNGDWIFVEITLKLGTKTATTNIGIQAKITN